MCIGALIGRCHKRCVERSTQRNSSAVVAILTMLFAHTGRRMQSMLLLMLLVNTAAVLTSCHGRHSARAETRTRTLTTPCTLLIKCSKTTGPTFINSSALGGENAGGLLHGAAVHQFVSACRSDRPGTIMWFTYAFMGPCRYIASAFSHICVLTPCVY